MAGGAAECTPPQRGRQLSRALHRQLGGPAPGSGGAKTSAVPLGRKCSTNRAHRRWRAGRRREAGVSLQQRSENAQRNVLTRQHGHAASAGATRVPFDMLHQQNLSHARHVQARTSHVLDGASCTFSMAHPHIPGGTRVAAGCMRASRHSLSGHLCAVTPRMPRYSQTAKMAAPCQSLRVGVVQLSPPMGRLPLCGCQDSDR